MSLTAFDTHGKAFVRAVLNDETTTPETLLALTNLLKVSRASFSIFDIAHELNVYLPLAAVSETVAANARHAPPHKRRAA